MAPKFDPHRRINTAVKKTILVANLTKVRIKKTNMTTITTKTKPVKYFSDLNMEAPGEGELQY